MPLLLAFLIIAALVLVGLLQLIVWVEVNDLSRTLDTLVTRLTEGD